MGEPAEAGDHLKIGARLAERELKYWLQVCGCLTSGRLGFGDSTLHPLDMIGAFGVHSLALSEVSKANWPQFG